MTDTPRTSLVDFVLSSFDTALQKLNWFIAIVAGALSLTSTQLNRILVVVTIVLGVLNSVLTALKIIKLRKEMRG